MGIRGLREKKKPGTVDPNACAGDRCGQRHELRECRQCGKKFCEAHHSFHACGRAA